MVGPLPILVKLLFLLQTREKCTSLDVDGQLKFFFFGRNYNSKKKKPVTREEAMEELIQVVTTCLL
jgi:hypothetical protein